jgi:hypothetical protein
MIWVKCRTRSGLTIAFIFVFSAGFLVVAGPKHICPGESQVDVLTLVAKMFNVAIIPFVTRAALAISAPMLLKFKQPSPDLFPLVAVKVAVVPSRRGCDQTRWDGNCISIERVHR